MERDFHHLSEIRNIIESLDLIPIINRMVKVNGWTEKQARTAASQYKNFLFLKKKYGSEYTLPPSEDIDEFWHNHILDTQKYHADCEAIFGRYLHHYPYFGIDGKTNTQDLNNAFNTTQELYNQEFGDYIYEVRNKGFLGLIQALSTKIINTIKALASPLKNNFAENKELLKS